MADEPIETEATERPVLPLVPPVATAVADEDDTSAPKGPGRIELIGVKRAERKARKEVAAENSRREYEEAVQANRERMEPLLIERDVKIANSLNGFIPYIDYWMPDISRIEDTAINNGELEIRQAQDAAQQNLANAVASGKSNAEIERIVRADRAALEAIERKVNLPSYESNFFDASTLSTNQNDVFKAFEGTQEFRDFIKTFDQSESVADLLLTVERLAFHMRNIDLARISTEGAREENYKLALQDNFVFKPYVHHATDLMDFARGCLLEVLESKTVDPMMKNFCEDTFEMVLQRSFEVLKKAEVKKSKLERFVDSTKISGKFPQPLVRKAQDDGYKIIQRKYKVLDDGDKGIEPESFVEEAILTGHLRRKIGDLSIKEQVITRLKLAQQQFSNAFTRPTKFLARFGERNNAIPTINDVANFVRPDEGLPWFYGTSSQINRWWNPIRDAIQDTYLDETDLISGLSDDQMDEFQLLFEDELDALTYDKAVEAGLIGETVDTFDREATAKYFLNQMRPRLFDKDGNLKDGFDPAFKDLFEVIDGDFETVINNRRARVVPPWVPTATPPVVVAPTATPPHEPAVAEPAVETDPKVAVEADTPEVDEADLESVLDPGDVAAVVSPESAESIDEADVPVFLKPKPTPPAAVVSLTADPAPEGERVVITGPSVSGLDSSEPNVEPLNWSDLVGKPQPKADESVQALDLDGVEVAWGSETFNRSQQGSSAPSAESSAEHEPVTNWAQFLAPKAATPLPAAPTPPAAPEVPKIVVPTAATFAGFEPVSVSPPEPTRSANGSIKSKLVEIRSRKILADFDAKLGTKPHLDEACKVVRDELVAVLATTNDGYYVKHGLMNSDGVDVKKANEHFIERVEENLAGKSADELNVDVTDLLRVTSEATRPVPDSSGGLNI